MSAPAIFLDRDGTLVHARHFPSRPADLILFDGIADGLTALQRQGFQLVVITNQSGIARGYFSPADLDAMHAHLAAELARFGVTLAGIYHCPHHPEGVIPDYAIACDCRKPQPGMLLQAARDLDLDLEASWFLGDILDDVEAGNRAGCRTVLVDLGTERPPDQPLRRPTYVARDTIHALRIVRAVTDGASEADLDYLPPAWMRNPHAA